MPPPTVRAGCRAARARRCARPGSATHCAATSLGSSGSHSRYIATLPPLWWNRNSRTAAAGSASAGCSQPVASIARATPVGAPGRRACPAGPGAAPCRSGCAAARRRSVPGRDLVVGEPAAQEAHQLARRRAAWPGGARRRPARPHPSARPAPRTPPTSATAGWSRSAVLDLDRVDVLPGDDDRVVDPVAAGTGSRPRPGSRRRPCAASRRRAPRRWPPAGCQYSTNVAGCAYRRPGRACPAGSGFPSSSRIRTSLPGQTSPAEPSTGLPGRWSAGGRQVT